MVTNSAYANVNKKKLWRAAPAHLAELLHPLFIGCKLGHVLIAALKTLDQIPLKLGLCRSEPVVIPKTVLPCVDQAGLAKISEVP
jgi:hypothetical protein